MFLVLEGVALITYKRSFWLLINFTLQKAKQNRRVVTERLARTLRSLREVSIWPNIPCMIWGPPAFLILLFISISLIYCVLYYLYIFFFRAFPFFSFFRNIIALTFRYLLFWHSSEKHYLTSPSKESSHTLFFHISLPYLIFPPIS